MGENKKFKFDVIIGNPPYQEERQGDSNTATPVYNIFMSNAYEICNKVMFITPARFLFNTGYTSKSWNEERLTDKHFKVEVYYPKSSDVFSDVDIKGGVAVTYRDTNKDFGAIEVFTAYPLLNSILQRIIHRADFKSLTDIMVTSFAYHFTQILYDENPNLEGRASNGHAYDLQSNIFDTMPEIFKDGVNNKDKDYIRILGRSNNKRCWKFIKRRYVNDVENLDKYKVYLPKATGSGKFGEMLPDAILGQPGDGATITFLSIGSFNTDVEAGNCIKYLKTKFARALLSVLKVTQNASKSVYKMIPQQDFTPHSDIDWSQSIPDIDKQLYKKYGLSQEEIDFIESHVKEMA